MLLTTHSSRRSRSGDLGLAAAVGIGLLLVALFLVVVPLSGARPRDPATLTLWWVVLGYCVLRLCVLTYRNTRRWAELCFWAFCYVWLGLAGLAQYIADVNPLWTHIDDDLARTQALVILAGFVAFDLGGALHARWPRVPRPHPGRWVPLGRASLLGVLSLVLSPVFVYALGGVGSLFSSRQDVYLSLVRSGLYSDSGNALGGILRTFANALPYVAMLGLVALAATDRRRLRDVRVVVLLVLVGIVNVVLNNPISNARYWFFAFVIGSGLFLAGRWRGRIVPAFLVCYIGMASLAFPYLDAFRTSGGRVSTLRAPVEFFLGKTDYGAVTDIGLGVRLALHSGYQDGQQLLGALLFWVPRATWPDKPENTGLLIAADTHFPNHNIDSPLWAEGFVDFGLVGVLLVLGVFGLVCRIVDTGYQQSLGGSMGGRVHWMQLLGPTFAGYLAIIVRGSLLQAMAGIVVLMALMWLASSPRPAPLEPFAPVPSRTG